MIVGWEEFLKEMFYKLIYTYNIFNKGNAKDIEIKVSFGDYISPERSEAYYSS